MKSSRVILLVIVLIAVLLAVKFIFLNSNTTGTSQTASAPKNASVPVYAIIAKTNKLQNKIFASGTVLANEEVELRPEASGKVLRVNFREGTQVSQGELLIKINDADLVAQLKKLDVQIKLSSEQVERQKKLLDIQGISQEEYDIALSQFNSLKSDQEYTRAQLAKTELRAPFSGVIGLKNISEGSYVSPNQTIAWLQQIDPVKIDFSIPEKYAPMIHKGDQINFSNANIDSAKGEVYAIQPRIDIATRTLQVRAISPNKQGKIVPGSFVKVELVLSEYTDAILVPTEAIVPVLKGKNVFLARNGKAFSQKVETGIRTDTTIQVTNGIRTGDTVITSGLMQLRQEMPVKITLKD
jgi:membrane fusion protein (multidrug efflux system)